MKQSETQKKWDSQIVSPTSIKGTVRSAAGILLKIPKDWSLLIPGDAMLTRRVKASGPTWTVQEKKGRRTFSLGIWAPTETIESIRLQVDAERGTQAYAKRMLAQSKLREKKQVAYADDFHSEIIAFLDFHPRYREIGEKLAQAVTRHATPIGSGTVARTQRIPIEQRAEAAVIAWLRHQTTAYDQLTIPRIRGKRREVRRMLADESRNLLECYRQGLEISKQCPLRQATEESIP